MIDSTIRALSDPTRRRAVELLSEGPARAGDLARDVGVPAATMSKHLRVLLGAGVVADCRSAADARVRVFQLQEEPMAGLHAWLDQLQAHWDVQLGAFRTHIEARGRQ
jgi:DNA-binding transcriptional ArsR family regulator